MFQIPILLITYKRPEKAKLVIHQINAINPERVYVFNDYAANDEVRNKVELTKQVVKDCLVAESVFENFATQNLGCKYGPETAISWFFENEEYGIILEEDCLPSPDFFKFCEEMLVKYRADKSILQINGTNLISAFTANQKSSYYLSTVTSAWGWASWRRAWQLYTNNILNYKELCEKEIFENVYPKKEIRALRKREVEMVLMENFDAWDYTWRFVVNQYGYAITPKVNLVKNIGFDEEATHTKEYDETEVGKWENIKWPLVHPKLIYNNVNDLFFYKKFYPYLFKKNDVSFLKKIIWKGRFFLSQIKHKLIK